MTNLVPIFRDLDGAVGCDYWLRRNQLLVVESDGDIDAIKLADNSHQIIGSGYQDLADIKISRDGEHAYVTGGQGTLLRVDLNHPDQAHARVVSRGMTAPHQIVLDEDNNVAHVVEFAPAGRLLRIDLGTGSQTTIATGLRQAVGLLMTSDRQFAYVSEQTGGAITRIRLATGNRDPVVQGLAQPFFLTWLGSGENAILTTERDPAKNKVVLIDLTRSPAVSSEIATVPTRPSSVAVVAGDQVYVCSDQAVSKLSLSGFGANDPILMGIGHVPVSRIGPQPNHPNIPAGMATTDPGYFFSVVDSPFGGSLPLMINHQLARKMGATHYRIVVDNTELPVAQFSDYRWNSAALPLPEFELVANPLPPGPDYSVRAANEIWYNPWLGAFVDSTTQPNGLSRPNGLHTIAVRLFDAHHGEIGHISDAGRAVQVMIDNGTPIAAIDKILHNGVEVPVCAIEHLGVDNWTFQITARDAEQHLRSWALSVVWGDNKSAGIASGNYVHNPKGHWEGLPPDPNIVPQPPWHAKVEKDKTSTNCAHTFYLGVWDRVIDGWSYIHSADYHKSITIIP
ncbi:MAG TPA: hypothetical protein VHQ90_12890 [Thermoanaerobaculia bacterium]|nr:hypothetical protein [Thermoanaerobaculia bacterium]